MRFPWPLRYTVPGISLLLGLSLGLSSLLYERKVAQEQVETLSLRHLDFIGNQFSALSAYFLGRDDTSGLQRQVSALGADQHLRLALILDDQKRVVAASQYEFFGTPLESSPLAYAGSKITHREAPQTVLSEDRETLLGIFPFSLPPAHRKLLSPRNGYLLLEYDLGLPKKQVMQGLLQRSFTSFAGYGIVCLLVWAFFHRFLNRRIELLTAATEKLAAGQSTEWERLTGSDELAKLSQSFDLMAQRISASTSGLRDANVRMKQEINERKFIEEALRNSERRFRSIWENSLEPMVLTDGRGIILAANDAYCKLVEKEAHELLQRPFVDAYASENAEDEMRRYEEAFVTRVLERWQQKKVTLSSGREIDIEVSPSFIEMERGRSLLLTIFRDITDKKKQEEQRLALERKLLESQKLESLGVLAGGIAHDFNNLLAAILGNTNLAQMQIKPESPLTGYLKNVEKTSLRAADLCKQMLAYAGKGRFTLQYLNLNEVVRETLELLEVSITKKAGLRVELRNELPNAFADPAQIRQVVMNLVINASEALCDKPGLIRIRTGSLKADAEYFQQSHMGNELPAGEYVYVEVSDTGCGMSAETQARIFDPFFTTKFTGRGLGLAAVLGIVRGHHGALKISSEQDKGSSFKFLLPAAVTIVPQGQPNTTTNIAATARGGGTILVVDDDPSVRAVTSRMVEAAGFAVLQAVDGRHGVEVFSHNHEKIRAVVLDMAMPNLSGREALEEMRRVRPDVKVLLISGFSEHFTNGDFDKSPPNGFLQKPFKSEELSGKLDSIFANGQALAPAA